jgi:UDP-glucose 4-epimerase
MRFDAVINKYAFEANFHNRITIQGSGEQHRAFIHVNDLVHDLAKLIEHDDDHGVYNLVSKNLSISDIADVYKTLRPELEFLFIDQHLDLRNIQVDTNLKVGKLIELAKPKPLAAELEEFLAKFSY